MDYKGEFPELLLLAEIIFVLPPNNACYEWGFSCMKRIKTDWRASLTPKVVDLLMRALLGKKSGEMLDPDILKDVAERLWASGQRSKCPNIMD